MIDLIKQLSQLKNELRRVSRELEFRNTVTSAMLATLDLEHVLYVILSGITSGDGLGFNRAFLFLEDESGRALRVVMALGPADPQQAQQIWEELLHEGVTLEALLPRYEAYRSNQAAHQLTRHMGGVLLPLDRLEDLALPTHRLLIGKQEELLPALARCLLNRTPFASNGLELVHGPPEPGAPPLIFRKLAMVPLQVGGRLIGAILADNFYSNGEVRSEDLGLLDGLGNLASLAIHRARLHSRMVAMAEVDGLTGVYNRRFYDETLARSLQASQLSGQPLALVIFDLDHFKAVNDRHGHLVGDEVLKHVARTLRASVRKSDVLARYGGEEFVLLLRNTDAQEAVAVAEKLCLAVKDHPPEGTPVERVTLSAGVAVHRGEAEPGELFRRADAALYQAKSGGRDRVCLWSE